MTQTLDGVPTYEELKKRPWKVALYRTNWHVFDGNGKEAGRIAPDGALATIYDEVLKEQKNLIAETQKSTKVNKMMVVTTAILAFVTFLMPFIEHWLK